MAAVKALQQWCKVRCDGYRDVAVTNMTTSFRDGLAFCALIHKHRPDLIDFDSLKKEDVYENNKLAFTVAEEELGIPALLDAEDMVALKVPDRLSILTYVSQYYNYFHGRSPIGGMGGTKRPAEGPAVERPAKKNQPVASREFPASKPAGENAPPRSPNVTRPFASPKATGNAKRVTSQDCPVEKPHQTGTLSNKCVSCNKHVHLVQRHLVDGRLYHRSCMRLLSPTYPAAPLRDLPTNVPVSKFTSLADSNKPNTNTPVHDPPRPGPTWPKDKPSTPPSFSCNLPSSSPSPSRRVVQTPLVSKTASSWTPGESTFTTTAAVLPRPTPAPRTSTTAAKTLESKLKFLQSDSTMGREEEKPAAPKFGLNKGLNATRKVQQASAGQAVGLPVNVGGAGRKETSISANTAGDKAKADGVAAADAGKASDTKAKAAAFICKALAEESGNDKPAWTTVVLKKTDKPSPGDAPKKETEAVRGRMRLKADPALLADLRAPDRTKTSPSPTHRSGVRTRTPERGGVKPGGASPNASASESESPADWRLKLKPVSKEAKPSRPSTPPPSPWANKAGKPQTAEPSAEPPPSRPLTRPFISVTPPAPTGLPNGRGERRPNGATYEPKVSKIKPDYIRKEDILKELQDIENSLTELENKGVELEAKLRRCDDDREDNSLMVEWFSLIRNKQVAMRRESELVYIGRTQDLEEQQPSVEQELRRLMDKPEHLKTSWERKKEEQLIGKLLGIVNDRNAIVDGLDEDRLREEEEDEQLNKMLKDFNIKTEKTRRKSPMSRLFGWGSKKEE
ncbi:protein-methionine sulfoxide oxidase mical2b [Brachionichthys hirsutus]|uniref:protein-methionine sulfoxide oxidase mical2b n=1 Tax=Brachionichthys hirsutus TaxID=412623 RepID=UPI0036052F98